MSSQDRLEHVLRDIHIMISRSETYDSDRIIVSKTDIFNLIDRLNASVYEIMDEYELTQQSRDRALRENKKEGDKIIWDASRQAEDIYAASVLYTEEALNHLHGIVEYANETIGKLYKDFRNSMRQQQETIRENQLELESQLQLLADTGKYLNLIEERNREIERERARRKGGKVFLSNTGPHKAIKPEIKINEAYFRKAGIPLEPEIEEKEEEMEPLEDEGVIESTLKKVAEDVRQEILEEKEDSSISSEQEKILENDDAADYETDTGQMPYTERNADLDGLQRAYEADTVDREAETDVHQENKTALEDQIKVNLDAEYFKWKNDGAAVEQEEEPHHEKTSLLDKLMGKKRSF